MFKLVIQDDEGKTTIVPLIRDEITIGNAPGTRTVGYGMMGQIDDVWIGTPPLARAQVQSLYAGAHADSNGACTEQPKKSNVMVVFYDPLLPDQRNTDLNTFVNGNDPLSFSGQIVDSIRTSSHGLVNYQIVDSRTLNEWPAQRAGAKPLNEANFFHPPPDDGYVNYPGGNADYAAMFDESLPP